MRPVFSSRKSSQISFGSPAGVATTIGSGDGTNESAAAAGGGAEEAAGLSAGRVHCVVLVAS